MILTETEIPASPEEVRAVFDDVTRWPEWHHSLIKKLRPAIGNISLANVRPGDILEAEFDLGAKLNLTVVVNTPREFRWTAKMPLLGSGEHFFTFEPSTAIPGGTYVTHGESHGGFLAVMFAQSSPLYGLARPRFQQFCEDLRGRVAHFRSPSAPPPTAAAVSTAAPVAVQAEAPPVYPAGEHPVILADEKAESHVKA